MVNPEDTVFHLGDVGSINFINKDLNGKKILILGNHDTHGMNNSNSLDFANVVFLGGDNNDYYRQAFDEVHHYYYLTDEILLTHAPVADKEKFQVHESGSITFSITDLKLDKVKLNIHGHLNKRYGNFEPNLDKNGIKHFCAGGNLVNIKYIINSI